MDLEERVGLVKQVGEEIVTEEELRSLFETKQQPVVYDGFEPSGRMHLAQGLLRAINVSKMVRAGTKFILYAADWHAWTNLKFGGDLKKIRVAGDYLVETWRACGMPLDKVEFVRAKDLVEDPDYWRTVIEISKHSTVKRVIRCSQIMGRTEDEVLQASQIFYPCMQAADVFALKADITQLGMDQRKVYMLAREVGPSMGYWKPVVVSHHMLMGLQGPPKEGASAEERAMQMKMSKSRPDSAIFMTDSAAEVEEKVSKAYCPEKTVDGNPVLEYCKYILFEKFDAITIERPAKFGGSLELQSYAELEGNYRAGKLHPLDLKKAVAKHVNELLDPVREHFAKTPRARKLLEQVNSFSVTR